MVFVISWFVILLAKPLVIWHYCANENKRHLNWQNKCVQKGENEKIRPQNQYNWAKNKRIEEHFTMKTKQCLNKIS